jgi:hypothetical protein
MGLNKLALGFLPFLLSNCMGRRPILLTSVCGFFYSILALLVAIITSKFFELIPVLAMLAAWFLIVLKLVFGLDKHLAITALGLFMTGVIDPNWKIIHLFSIELFPTPVRNMAR